MPTSHLIDHAIPEPVEPVCLPIYCTPRLNGKVERSHRTDAEEFYRLLEYKGDVDLNNKLAEWEIFYNFSRPHSSHGGKTPYEILREKLA